MLYFINVHALISGSEIACEIVCEMTIASLSVGAYASACDTWHDSKACNIFQKYEKLYKDMYIFAQVRQTTSEYSKVSHFLVAMHKKYVKVLKSMGQWKEI